MATLLLGRQPVRGTGAVCPAARLNYRHAFHAGNHGDVVKHGLLIWMLRALQRKPGALFVLDTHAGRGRYDLMGAEATRTGEWRHGIGRLLDATPEPLSDYVGLVRGLGLYPGSPAIIRALLRPQDRLACCELHPEDHAALRTLFTGDRQVAVHRRDAWEALRALLPPAEKRGLVLIDPAYEAPNDMELLAVGLRIAATRFPNAVVTAWCPVKHLAPIRLLRANLGLRDVVAATLTLREPLDPTRLNGSMLVVIHPPFGFEDAARVCLEAMLPHLAPGQPNAATAIERWAAE